MISLTALGVAGDSGFDGFWVQDAVGKAWPTFYIDDITLLAGAAPPPSTNGAVTLWVDAAANRHAISDLIYGVAFAGSNEPKELNAPLNRSGGNAQTRYNWQQNASNRGSDWFFESIAESSSTPGAAADAHVRDSRNGGAEPALTIPMIRWLARVPADRSKLASYSIAKYGAQSDRDAQWFPDAGNGTRSSDGAAITWNDPSDANVLTDSAFQQNWVQHLTNRWGRATNGGVRYYCMDNEWSLWDSTHRDVHPTGATMRETRDLFFDFAGRAKAVDAGAIIMGPEEWGWSGYFYSGYDQQWMGLNGDYNPAHFPDRGTNGGWDYMPWFLDQCRQRATNSSQRLLDVFTAHYYPQGGEYGYPSDLSSAMQARRNRSTRSLWDTNYVDETWINAKVRLIPRMKQWVASYYPGTKIGITEYNWGGEEHMNGATARADVLGIFGREGVDLATRWATPPSNSPAFKALKIYRNYDNARSAFGDTSLAAGGANPDSVAVFAAQRSRDNALTVMVINKSASATPATITVSNFLHSGAAQRWVLETNAITRRNDVNLTGNAISASLSPQSITLFVAPAAQSIELRPTSTALTNGFNARLIASAGQRVVIEGSPNLQNSSWSPVQTNTVETNGTLLRLPTNGPARFFRAVITE